MSRAASRSLIAWLAALSLLLGGLLPSVAQAMPATPAFEMAICSVAGAVTSQQQHGAAVHCLACCQHGQSLALPVTAVALPVHAWPASRPVPAAFAVQTGEQPYPRARPRGPPRA